MDLRVDHSNLPEQEPVKIMKADIQRVSNMKSWPASGPDTIHTYLLKKLTALHDRLAAHIEKLLTTGTYRDQLTQGRTVLIMKGPHKGTSPSHYSSITCLSTSWKLLSGIIAAKLNRHMSQHKSKAQKGIIRPDVQCANY